jgi:endonuclease YncB( thermonuclease family)
MLETDMSVGKTMQLHSAKKMMRSIAAVLIILISIPNSAYATPATVIRVHDGDTLNVDVQGEMVTLRLYGIDAPESGQDGNVAASRFLRRLVLEHPVEIKVMETNRLKQTSAIVVREGKESSVNAAMVANGYAWVYPDGCKADACRNWKKMESQARTLKLGIWSDYDVVPPWEFKKQQR